MIIDLDVIYGLENTGLVWMVLDEFNVLDDKINLFINYFKSVRRTIKKIIY